VDATGVYLLVAALGAIATFAGFFAWFEILDYPRPQYCLLLLPVIFVSAFSRQRWGLLCCLPLAVNLLLIAPLFLLPSSDFNPGETVSQPFRIIHANLDRDNQNSTPAINYIEAQDVDVILLQEVTPKWLTSLKSHLSRYRIFISVPLENSQGVAMLLPVKPSTSIQVVKTKIIHLPAFSPRPLLVANLKWENHEVTLLSLSLARPTNPFQQAELKAVAQWVQRQANPLILIGDFNLTPWSRRFRWFLAMSKLHNSQQGFGLQPTWPAGWPDSLQVAIDHCLHSPSISTINRATGVNIRSDHLPILVELVLVATMDMTE